MFFGFQISMFLHTELDKKTYWIGFQTYWIDWISMFLLFRISMFAFWFSMFLHILNWNWQHTELVPNQYVSTYWIEKVWISMFKHTDSVFLGLYQTYRLEYVEFYSVCIVFVFSTIWCHHVKSLLIFTSWLSFCCKQDIFDVAYSWSYLSDEL